MVISHEFLMRRFGGRVDVVGRSLETSIGPYEIVGVAEPGLTLPMPGPFASSGDLRGFGVDVWMAMRLNPAGPFFNNHPNVGIGRLKPDATVESAQTDLETIFGRFTDVLPRAYSKGFIKSYNFRVRVESLQQTVLGPQLPRTLWMLFGAVLLVLGIAAANVANLYLVRLDVRRRESAVRAALGADRSQLATHYLAETLLLCGAAAVAGLLVAVIGLRAVLLVAPADIPRLASVSLDARSASVAIAIAMTLGVFLGVLPLFRRGVDLEALRAGSRGQSASARQRLVRNILVVGQLAMALVLLTAAGLMLRSFGELRKVQPGFDTANVLAFDISLPHNEYGKRSASLAFHAELQRRLRALPGVSEVGSISDVPLEGFGTGCSVVFREKQPYSADEKTPCVSTPIATPGVFAALRIAIEGRAPTWGDVETRTQAVVVTRALANRLWPGENPIGKGINSNGPDAPRWYRVVGVAADIKAEALDAPNSEAVFYAATTLGDDDDSDGLTDHAYLVRTSGIDPLSLQRGQYPAATVERYLALAGGAAKEYGDLAEIHCRSHCISTNLPGTAPIEPAPMVNTTSPARATSRIVCGMAAMSSTKTGSTLPTTRKARASERPSAATMGASPAAYTSARQSASTVDSTLTKSSKQSRVRV